MVQFNGSYDYIIIGKSVAGCVLAERLTRDADCRVLLLQTVADAADWRTYTEPQAYCGQRQLSWAPDRLDRPHAIQYGHDLDYDLWAYHGCVGWDEVSLQPYFQRVLAHLVDGPPSTPIERFLNGARAAGHPRVESSAKRAGTGAGRCQIIPSIYDSYLAPAQARPNLTMLSDVLPHRLEFDDDDRCIGVTVSQNEQQQVIHTGGEVILCAGAIENPKLLLLSGVGPAVDSAKLSIDVQVNLPGVGRNLQDHLLCPLVVEGDDAAQGYTAAQVTWKSDERQLIPDSALLLKQRDTGYTFWASLLRPYSHGRVALLTAEPTRRPLVDPEYLREEMDVLTLILASQTGHEILRQMDDIDVGESPTAGGLIDMVRQRSIPARHHSGTCRMGVDELAVVDPELRVYGVDGLRVADASIFPHIPVADPTATIIAVAEKAADFLQG